MPEATPLREIKEDLTDSVADRHLSEDISVGFESHNLRT